jgi:hypothetical protein
MPLEKFLEFAEIVRQYIAARNQVDQAKNLQIAELLARVAELENQLASALNNLAIALSNDASDAQSIARAQADAKAAVEAANQATVELDATRLQLQKVINEQVIGDSQLVEAIAKLEAEIIG